MGTRTACPLLPAQQAHWELVCAKSPSDPGQAGHLSIDVRELLGTLDEHALRQAFADITRRHEGLRLAFASTGPDPLIRVLDEMEPPVDFRGLASADPARRRDQVADLLFAETRRCFELRTGPLWHAWIVRLDAARHWVVLCVSHLIADGWSMKVMVDDLFAAYGARAGHGAPPAADAPTLAEVRDLQAGRLAPEPRRLRFWRERLTAISPELPFPPAADPGADLLTRANVPFSIPRHVAGSIQRLAWRSRTTPFVALMAAHHLQLAILTGGNGAVISTAALAGITPAERKAICLHASDPYVAVALAEEWSLRDVVLAAHEAMTGALANLVPFTDIARAVCPGFDARRPWADPHLFDGNFIDSAFDLGHFAVAGITVGRPSVRLPAAPAGYQPALTWSGLSGTQRRIWGMLCGPGFEVDSRRSGGVLHYNPEVYPAALMRQIVEGYLWTAAAMADEPGLTVGALRERYPMRYRTPESA